MVLGGPQRHGKGRCRAQAEGDALQPLRTKRLGRSQPGRNIEHYHQTDQNRRHDQRRAQRRPRPAQRPGQQRQLNGKGIHQQQGHDHGDARHRRIETQALDGHHQASQQLPATGTGRKGDALALPEKQHHQHGERRCRAHQHGQQQAGALVESQACRYVIAGEQGRDSDQDGNGEMAGQQAREISGAVGKRSAHDGFRSGRSAQHASVLARTQQSTSR